MFALGCRKGDMSVKYSLLAKTIITLAVMFIFTACGSQYDMDSSTAEELAGQEQFDAVPGSIFTEELYIHWDDGITQFGSRVEGNVSVLYAIENHGSHMTQLAVFPSFNVEWGNAETQWCSPQNIFYLDVVDDWVILSAGQIQGSMANFFGDLHRVRRDGSGREAFNLGSMNRRFIIIDGWVYHNIWCAQDLYGWIRIRPDGTGREFVGDFIHTIILFGDDGYIYGTNAASGLGNLARWRPESNESVTLFLENNAPVFDEFFSRVSYRDIVPADGYVYFTVSVFGVWDYAQPVGWRTPWEGLHTANFRVNKDGSSLALLHERYHMTMMAFDLLRSVLQNEKQFTFVSGFGSFYLDEYLNYEMPQAHEMAVFDLFGNGMRTVILNLGYTLKLVLFYYDGEIWADEFGIRSMNGITRYGTFGWSGGSGSAGVARVELAGNEINYVAIFGRDWLWQGERVDGHIYFMYDSLISYEEYAALLEKQFSKEKLSWHPFTAESIHNLVMLETLRVWQD